MACKKHPIRKRKDCPDCQAELNVKHQRVAIPKKEEAIPQQTSRDMLKEMEKEEEALVIKKERKKKDPVVKMIEPPPTEAELQQQVDEAVKETARLEAYKQELENIDKYFKEKLSAFKIALANLSMIKYEHKLIPLKEFRFDMLNNFEKDGWVYKDMWIGDVAKVSGCKEDMVVLTRVKK